LAVTVTHSDAVTILDIGDDENRFSPDWLDAVNAALDATVAGPPTALVLTATGKFFTNGLDLEWLMANPDQWGPYADRVQQLLSRMLTLPLPTIAAVNGHAFGGGAMLALACDFRVMREDRGFFCLPEVDIRIPFTPGMNALLLAKLTPRAATLAMTTGRRFGGVDSRAFGIVDATADEAGLLEAALAAVAPLVGKDTATLATIKSRMYADVTTAFALPVQ
jgi:enoyl-CoA hydratase/carnithine racemase